MSQLPRLVSSRLWTGVTRKARLRGSRQVSGVKTGERERRDRERFWEALAELTRFVWTRCDAASVAEYTCKMLFQHH